MQGLMTAGYLSRTMGCVSRSIGLCAVLWISSGVSVLAHADLTDAEIGQATQILKQWIYEHQEDDGSWEDGRGTPHAQRHTGGKTSLAVLAMLYAGESFQSEHGQKGGVAAALKWLERNPVWGTYTYAIRAHVWAALPDAYGPRLRRDAQFLMKAHRKGLFDYDSPPRPRRIDHSVTQYGVLGLWEYVKRGGNIPQSFWRDTANHFIASQREDGGWNYEGPGDDEPSYGSMTTAGLTMLFIARQEMLGDSGRIDRRVDEAIAKGLSWLDAHFSSTANPAAGEPHPHRGDRMYYWYGIERVALACGVKTFNGLDWYRTGADAIIQELLTKDLSRVRADVDVVEACFGLMFLVRGRVPVWCQKISLPDKEWNSRPDDLPAITSYLSDRFEQRLNWSVTSIDDSLEHWMLGPIAWLSSADGLASVDGRHIQTLNNYLNHGGLLVINPQGKRAVRKGLEAYAAEHWPGATLRQIDEDHPLLTLVNQVQAGPGDRPWVLSQGARDLVVLLPERWGVNFKKLLSKEGVQTDILANLFAAYTQRGQMPARLVTRYIEPPDNAERPFRVVRAVLDSSSDAVPEPKAWAAFSGPLHALTDRSMEIFAEPLAALAPGQADLVHLAGVGHRELTADELSALKAYVQGGGLVLVETLGGLGGTDDSGVSAGGNAQRVMQFSRSVARQIKRDWGQVVRPLKSQDPVLTGQGLGQGAAAVEAAVWRSFTRLRFNYSTRPRLTGVSLGEARVIFSHEDLSLGVMDLLHDRVHGYDSKTARQLLINMLWLGSGDS